MVAIASRVSARHGAQSPRLVRRVSAGTVGYALTAIALLVGWLLTRERALVDASDGIGYWLGIAGASMMATLLLYPVRKRIRALRVLGATRHWFRVHMIFGIAGPLLILYHCNFRFGSLNSTVALVCTLAVALSGLIGKYLYTKIYADLDGHKLDLKKLSERARLGASDGYAVAGFMPKLVERMTAFDELVLRPPTSFFATLVLPARLGVQTRWHTLRLIWFTSQQLRALARTSPAAAAERKRLGRTIRKFILSHQARVRRVAEFSSYERLFSLWHVFHLPFFYMLVLTAILHVIAVHMY